MRRHLFTDVRAFEAAAFAPRTAGFVGECTFCRAQSRVTAATYMARVVKTGSRVALCGGHAVPLMVGLTKDDIAAARAAVRAMRGSR